VNVINTTTKMIMVGDHVRFRAEYAYKFGDTIFEVIQLLRVNCRIRPANGGQVVRCNPAMLTLVGDNETSSKSADGDGTATTVTQLPEYFFPAEVVTVAGASWHQPPGLFVVLHQDARSGNCRITRLGGDRGRYWTRVPTSWLTRVDPTKIIVKE